MILVHVTRESVAAGDDGDAPHLVVLEVPRTSDVAAIVAAVVAGYRLPSIAGGRATWCVASRIPLAVIAQEWSEPRTTRSMPFALDE